MTGRLRGDVGRSTTSPPPGRVGHSRYDPSDRRPLAGVVLCVDMLDRMGGTEEQVVRLARELRRRGTAVRVLSRAPLHEDNPYVLRLKVCGAAVDAPRWLRARPGPVDLAAAVRWRLARIPPAEHEDGRGWRWLRPRLRALGRRGWVVHELPYFGVVSRPGLRVHQELRLPVVHTVLGRDERFRAVPLAPWAVLTADGVDSVEAPTDRVSWVPSMGPAEQDLPPPADRRAGLVFAGRLVDQKGVEVLVEALRGRLGSTLHWAGYGPREDHLRTECARLGIDAVFHGVLGQPALLRLLSGSRCLVVPSVSGEGVPSSFTDAVAVGTRVVASDLPALRRAAELVGPDVVRLAPPGAPAALRAALDEVLAAPVPDAEGCALRYAETLSSRAVVDQYVASYRLAVASSPRPSTSR